jgi:hypothetical protein
MQPTDHVELSVSGVSEPTDLRPKADWKELRVEALFRAVSRNPFPYFVKLEERPGRCTGHGFREGVLAVLEATTPGADDWEALFDEFCDVARTNQEGRGHQAASPTP